ncbi:proteasome subunit beta type [Thecamonas trahens ATCC 50062]|uniref:Proteasome subunit beta n=1 Tax=Thecamonas trahens ATCC 50062 TaxID=461836 RepID=A0A0L0D3M9_THETB|nr:proteasome subunit beta type [Thecamonas trahens ATCC 50062]KNC46937.1 proteasome subunit beta type [Thecamonas trahens ATCC 50062]|eukprot:XP_013760209.1 proteasome subunit beta type [Thecamonas trahens ATCC 50062]
MASMNDVVQSLKPAGGFEFDLCARNNMLKQMGLKAPKATSTGTTIVGLVYKDGVVLGADTRATGDTTVEDKNCEKIHYIAPNVYCCGAGTAADTENTTALISSQLELHRLATGRHSRVVTALTLLKRMLFRYQGHVSAALVLGGVDLNGPHLYTIYPHGSTDELPYVTMGSGSLAAMGVFEAGWKENMSEDEAVDLVAAAIRAGIFNDLGSGSNVDVTIIRGVDDVEVRRGYQILNPRPYARVRPNDLTRGTTTILSETRTPIHAGHVEYTNEDAVDMETSPVESGGPSSS